MHEKMRQLLDLTPGPGGVILGLVPGPLAAGEPVRYIGDEDDEDRYELHNPEWDKGPTKNLKNIRFLRIAVDTLWRNTPVCSLATIL